MHVRDVPDGYLTIRSGTGSATPRAVVVLPVLFEGECLGVIELGSVTPFSLLHLTFLGRLVDTIGVALATIQANRRTEELLTQSQRLTTELQDQSAELQRANAELEEKAEQLSRQNRNVEIKNIELDAARRGVEEKAQQLAQASQYKTEFMANMSHELRTPLNSLLLLSRLLAENPDANLTARQIEFANTIHGAGSDLLRLIDDILDLSKIEAGRAEVDAGPVVLAEVLGDLEQALGPQAEEKGLTLAVEIGADVPSTITTDSQRLQQVLRNLLANAVKFTDTGGVTLQVGRRGRARRVRGARHRHRHPGRQAGDDLRGVPAGGRHHEPQVRRHRAGAVDLQGAGAHARRAHRGDLHRRRGLGVHAAGARRAAAARRCARRAPGRCPGPCPGRWRAPLSAPTPLRGPALRVAPAVPALAGATVLIVDDDVRNVFALTSALELHGLTVLYADNGAAGIRLLTEHPEVDVVLMDTMMPDLDGNETTRLIRELPGGRELPVVFLTAKAMPGDREASLAAGATEYVTKPVDLDELLALMANWVTPPRRPRRVAR